MMNNLEDTPSNHKQLSDVVLKLSKQVEDVVTWLFCKEEELNQRPTIAILNDASFNQVFNEYSNLENFMTQISEYSHIIMVCKEEGQELLDNHDEISDEDRDEIGIQMDAMTVLYDKLKILTTDRLHNLQQIVNEKQKSNIDRLEKWLTSMETRLTSSDNIGPDYDTLQRQIVEIIELQSELQQKQDFLDIVSRIIIFDDHDQNRSCENLEGRLESMNERWTRICQLVNDRHCRLRQADAIWQLLHLEGPQLASWLREIQLGLNELSDATQNILDPRSEKSFLSKILTRSEKIDSDIKSKQLLYTNLENRVRMEIEKFDDPCSMFVIELEQKLEDMQENWNLIMRQKRIIDYKLESLCNPGAISSESSPSKTEAESDYCDEPDFENSLELNLPQKRSQANFDISMDNQHPEYPLGDQNLYNPEFDCIFTSSNKVSEDEVNVENIPVEDEIRCDPVEQCLLDRERLQADKEKWRHLSKMLQNTCQSLITQMGEIIPETEIGVDLITLAQQQAQLVHLKKELESNEVLHSCIEESKIFLKLYDILMQQYGQSQQHLPCQKSCDLVDIWLSIKEFKDEIECHLDRLTLHNSELSQMIEDRLGRIDEIHKEMHALQHCIQDLATKLQMSEILKSNWVPLQHLSIEQLSEQLEDLKLYRERLLEVESVHKEMTSIIDWMKQYGVPLSQSNLKRIGELNAIWDSIQSSVEERQKLIEHAFDEQSGSEQKFLSKTVSDLPNWERRVATSKVPYFINHQTNETLWDHPKFTKILESMDECKQYVFSAYRTAMKLRILQKSLGVDKLMLEQLKEFLNRFELIVNINNQTLRKSSTISDVLVGVEQIISLLKSIYERIQVAESPSLDVPVAIDLTLNWLLNLYDATRTGQVSALSLKVGLTLICCATREEKYTYMFELISDRDAPTVDAKRLGTLFEICTRIPTYLGEIESFGGSDLIETSIRNCLAMSKFNPQHPNCIDLNDYLNWLKTEPQFIIWLPVLHRLLISESTTHHLKCKLCGSNPILGLRYRCLRCFKFNICQKCFLTGRHVYEHHDPMKHPLREYCCPTSLSDQVRDFTRIIHSRFI